MPPPIQAHSAPNGHFHAVQFYNDPVSLSRIVGGFLAEGLGAGEPAVVIATPGNLDLVESNLTARSFDVEALKRRGELVVLDARDTLNGFMVDGMPDPRAFKQAIGQVLGDVCHPRPGCTVRAYGEMVNVLWQDGLEAAAIRLEMLWNELANAHDFKVLCGYSMGNFYKAGAVDEIKGHHSHVVDSTGAPGGHSVNERT